MCFPSAELLWLRTIAGAVCPCLPGALFSSESEQDPASIYSPRTQLQHRDTLSAAFLIKDPVSTLCARWPELLWAYVCPLLYSQQGDKSQWIIGGGNVILLSWDGGRIIHQALWLKRRGKRNNVMFSSSCIQSFILPPFALSLPPLSVSGPGETRGRRW